MICRKCKEEIPDNSIFCLLCGKKQIATQGVKTKKRGNNQGTVKKLSGNRAKPYVSLAPLNNGKREVIGTFATKKEANESLIPFSNKKINDRFNYTLEQIYDEWSKEHFKTLTKSGADGLRSAWIYCEDYKKDKIKDLKTAQYQSIIKKAVSAGKSKSTCNKIRQLISHLNKYALQYDIINKNYSEFLQMPKEEKKEKEIFTDSMIDFLFRFDKDDTVKIILMLIYTGLRINELFALKSTDYNMESNYLIGGSKTEAGINRIVPINEKAIPYFLYFLSQNNEYIVSNTIGGKKDIKNFRDREFYPCLEKYKMLGITPHSTRHTFISLSVKRGMPPELLKAIAGHADYSTSINFYNHTNIEELKKGIALL